MLLALWHAEGPLQPHDLWQSWEWAPGITIPLVLSAMLFLLGAWRNPGSHAKDRAGAFAAGWGALALALVSPLHRLGGSLFSAHMVQHEILMLVAAPLLVWSQPAIAFLWALPKRWRIETGTICRMRAVQTLWRLLTQPATAWSLHAAALWIWHIPALFQMTLASEWVHTGQHLSFFLTALLFWWALLHGRQGRYAYGAAVVYVFTTALHNSVLGALLTFARVAWYPAYGQSPAVWGLTPLEDQQLAGLIMWVPAGVVFVIAGLFLFSAWLRESDKRLLLRSRL